MTRQDKLNQAWCKYRGKCSTEIIQALAFALRWCDEHPHWISVEDELPPNKGGFSDEVLTCNLAINQCVVAQYNYISNCWFGCDDSVTHWMALPLLPEKLSNLERIGKNLKGYNDDND